jgi:hypothetical protein
LRRRLQVTSKIWKIPQIPRPPQAPRELHLLPAPHLPQTGYNRAVAEPDLQDTVALARRATGSQLETLLYHRAPQVVEAVLDNPRLGEQHLTILLARRDLAREIVVRVAENKVWMKSYPLKTAVLKHPRTPRHVALPLLKFIYPFDLMEIASAPGVAPDLKRVMEDALLSQRESLALGQRLTLARRGTHRICGGLLADSDGRVLRAALDNPSLTEAAVAAALLLEKASGELLSLVAEHQRWSARRDVRLALLRSKHLSLARFAAMLPELATSDLADLAEDPRLAPNLRAYVARLVLKRRSQAGKKKV